MITCTRQSIFLRAQVRADGGFSLIELLAAMTIVAMVVAVSVPSAQRFYESMQYRQAVRDVMTALSSARYRALNDGIASDVVIDPRSNRVNAKGTDLQLPSDLSLTLRTARVSSFAKAPKSRLRSQPAPL